VGIVAAFAVVGQLGTWGRLDWGRLDGPGAIIGPRHLNVVGQPVELAGLRRWVAMFGGHGRGGPDEHGGWRVNAELPRSVPDVRRGRATPLTTP